MRRNSSSDGSTSTSLSTSSSIGECRSDLCCGDLCRPCFDRCPRLSGPSLIKLSMLVFYRRFLTKKPYTTILYAFMAFVIMSTIATVIVCVPRLTRDRRGVRAPIRLRPRQPSIFHCKPIEAAWVLNLPGSTCPVYAQKLHVGSGVINLVTDVILIALPIPIVVHLKTSTRKKCTWTNLILCRSCWPLGREKRG